MLKVLHMPPFPPHPIDNFYLPPPSHNAVIIDMNNVLFFLDAEYRCFPKTGIYSKALSKGNH